MTEYRPRPYQQRVEDFIYSNPRCAVFVDMGLGKTAATLSAIGGLLAGNQIRAVLVVAPILVVESTWPSEIAKWRELRWMSYSLVRKAPAPRIIVRDLIHETQTRVSKSALDALLPGKDIYLTNYENLQPLSDWCEKQKTLPWDMVVFDESSKLKKPTGLRFKAVRKISNRCKRVVILTGTPRPDSYMDLWSQFYLVDQGYRLGEFITYYRDRYFSHNIYTHQYTIKDGAAEKIDAAVQDITVAMRTEDYLSLPPAIEVDVFVDLPPNARKVYDDMEATMAAELADGTGVTAETAAATSNKCRQATSGSVYHDRVPGAPQTWSVEHSAKLDALENIIEFSDGPVLAVYEFKSEIDALRKRWPKAPWIGSGSPDKLDAIRRWNERRSGPVMFVHPASVGHGLNLQDGGHTLVWLSGTWSNDLYRQMVKRLHRSGQTKPVTVHRIIARNTIDSAVYAAVAEKEAGQDSMMKVLSKYLLSRNKV